MARLFYTDKEFAELMGVSVSLIRKMEKLGPSRDGALDIRLIDRIVVGNMRRWNAEATDRLLGISSANANKEA